MYEISKGWFKNAQKIISSNYNERPLNVCINAIIIHSISLPPGCYQGNDISLFFANRLDCAKHPYYQRLHDLQVSAHLLIRRDGQLMQFVNLYDRAWHAGQSCLADEFNCNDFSIGIELEGTDNSVFEVAQYETLTQVVNALLNYFPEISIDRIVGHSDVAVGRKTDPGSGFDWQILRNSIS